MIEKMEEQKSSTLLKDILNIIGFIILVAVGVFLINSFVFRSFNVEGPSMEQTMYTGDKLIVNKIPVTLEHIQGKDYSPSRGQVIVFKNPNYSVLGRDEYIVKRVIGFGGERVVVRDGEVTVFNKSHPNGFNPDSLTSDKEGTPTEDDVDLTVSSGELFVMGDHREGQYSLDSRNGLGTVPLENVVGPVALRIFPFQNVRGF